MSDLRDGNAQRVSFPRLQYGRARVLDHSHDHKSESDSDSDWVVVCAMLTGFFKNVISLCVIT
jgi:hypothetical protein